MSEPTEVDERAIRAQLDKAVNHGPPELLDTRLLHDIALSLRLLRSEIAALRGG